MNIQNLKEGLETLSEKQVSLIYETYVGEMLVEETDLNKKVMKLIEASKISGVKRGILIETLDLNDEETLIQFQEMIKEIATDTSERFDNWVLQDCIDLQIEKKRLKLALQMVFELLMFSLKGVKSAQKGQKICEPLIEKYLDEISSKSSKEQEKDEKIILLNMLMDFAMHPVLKDHQYVKYELINSGFNFIGLDECPHQLIMTLEKCISEASNDCWRDEYENFRDYVKDEWDMIIRKSA